MYGADLYLNDELVTEIEIPDTISKINSYAFYGCKSLTRVVIPDSVTSIGDYAFYGCTGLTFITFEGTVAQWNAISRGSAWCHFTHNGHDYTIVTKIICSDGTVTIR